MMVRQAHHQRIPLDFAIVLAITRAHFWGDTMVTLPFQTREIVATGSVQEVFYDARSMYSSAVARLEAGDIRDAAEKAWCATKRATDALILARTGEEPGPTGMTSDLLDSLARQSPDIDSLVGRYYSRISQLHGACFCLGHCNDQTERRIRETAAYIEDAERQA